MYRQGLPAFFPRFDAFSLVAGLLWGTRLAQEIRRVLPLPERDALLPWLQEYKRQPERRQFQALLHAIGLNEQDT